MRRTSREAFARRARRRRWASTCAGAASTGCLIRAQDTSRHGVYIRVHVYPSEMDESTTSVIDVGFRVILCVQFIWFVWG